jgi:hypothetical protein
MELEMLQLDVEQDDSEIDAETQKMMMELASVERSLKTLQ